LTKEGGRPTCSTVKPSPFRDDEFETQFQPGRKNKVRQVHSNPGRGESSADDNVCNFLNNNRKQKKQPGRCQDLGRGEQRNARMDDSKQIGQTRSSSSHGWRTIVCMNCYFSGSRPKLSRKPGPKLGWPIWPKTRFKNRKLSQGAFRFRTLSRRCSIRFRARHHQNTEVYKKQQTCKLSRGTFRFRKLSRHRSV